MSKLADKLIAENKRTRSKTLDLANCGLSEIPAEVGELVWLESLYFRDMRYEPDSVTWLQSPNRGPSNEPLTGLSVLQKLPGLRSFAITASEGFSQLARLPALQSLGLEVRSMSDVTPLAALSSLQSLYLNNTQVSDVTALASLSSLQSLYLNNTQVSDVTALASLSSLQWLNLGSTQVSDVTALAEISSLQWLNLSNTQVSSVKALAEISSLQWLYLDNTQVSDVTALASLSSLQGLNLGSTQVSDVTALASLSSLQWLYLDNTQVSDVTALAEISSLQRLNLSNTQVSSVKALAEISSLQWLYLRSTQVSDVTALASLSKLQWLDLSNTNVSSVKALAEISSLQWLYLDNTQVSDVTALASLSSLRFLSLVGTPVSDLSPLLNLISNDCPVKWSSSFSLPDGPGIYVQDCPLINPPPQIVKQGNEAILQYFAERARSGKDQLYEAKMLIVGNGSAGKTSLLRRLYQPDQPLPTENESTKGIDIHQHTFPLKNGRTFRLNVWDFGGQEIYRPTDQFFLTHRSLYVLIDDTRSDDKSVQDPGFRHWLGLVEVFGGGSPVLIFQNEKSGRSKRIDLDGIKSRYTNVKEKYQGNLAKQDAADQLREGIEYFAAHLSHVGGELPASWIKVRADIEKRAEREPYITQQEYFDIYKCHLEFDESGALILSQYLHDLGVFLHFQKDLLLKGTVILQNEWATQAVFRILDDDEVKKKLGRFGEEDCARLWKGSAYAAKHAELLALMKNFELCYELPDKLPREWLVPQLLPPEKPSELKEWGQHEDLVLRYRYEFLPKGMISRLMVRMHRFVRRDRMAWATGVLFERGATTALVELLTDGKHLEIRARGPEAMGLLSAVSFDLDALNESFEGLKAKVARLVRCPCEACARTEMPHFFDHAELVRRMEHGKTQVECIVKYQMMDVVKLLYRLPGYVERERGERAGSSTVRIFLASSSELREERDAFELYLRQRNDEFRMQGSYLEIVRWENFLDALSDTRMQDEYNKAVRACDVFVALFFTKAGKFTDEEFEAALGQFKASGKPKIFTYFKNAAIELGSVKREDFESLWAFQEKLKAIGHYHSTYKNIEDLKLQFRDQLSRLMRSETERKSRPQGG